MVKLSQINDLLVEEAKIVDYLLSEENSRGKSNFFVAFGFDPVQWHHLERALIQHASAHEIK